MYCGCNVVVKKDHSIAAPYIDHLIAEIELADVAHDRKTTQLHWGGGTPTYLDPHQIRELYNAIAERFSFEAGGEYSIEIDPRVTSFEHLRMLRELGFNRLSMGIQDFDWNVQFVAHGLETAFAPDYSAEARVHAAERLSQAVALVSDGSVPITTVLADGVPYETINRIAAQKNADLIVINLQGKGLLDRALIGTTAERVIRTASIPVLSLPLPAAYAARWTAA